MMAHFYFFLFIFLLFDNNLSLCKVVGLACSAGLLPAALDSSFLGNRVGIGPTTTQFGPDCA